VRGGSAPWARLKVATGTGTRMGSGAQICRGARAHRFDRGFRLWDGLIPRPTQVRHDGGVEIRPGLTVDDQVVEEFCQSHQIRRLAVFGSALRGDFRATSDVDVLVEFHPGAAPGLLRIAQMELEFSALVGGREVEMRTYEDLSRDFRDTVRAEATTLYEAA
jgi:uncharacterized protein